MKKQVNQLKKAKKNWKLLNYKMSKIKLKLITLDTKNVKKKIMKG